MDPGDEVMPITAQPAALGHGRRVVHTEVLKPLQCFHDLHLCQPYSKGPVSHDRESRA